MACDLPSTTILVIIIAVGIAPAGAVNASAVVANIIIRLAMLATDRTCAMFVEHLRRPSHNNKNCYNHVFHATICIPIRKNTSLRRRRILEIGTSATSKSITVALNMFGTSATMHMILRSPTFIRTRNHVSSETICSRYSQQLR